MDFNGLTLPDWFGPLCAEIDRELGRLSRSQPDRRPALEQEVADLRTTIRGWSVSLAKPALDATLREDLEAQYVEAKARLRECEAALAALEGEAEQRHRLLDPELALARLHRLADL